MNGITFNILDEYWPVIERKIKIADKKANFLKRFPLEYIKSQLLGRHWQCWKEDETFFITAITVYPSGYKEFEILLVCGEGMEKWNKLAWLTLKKFAESYDCSDIRFQGRPGWSRYGKHHEPELKTEYMYKVAL